MKRLLLLFLLLPVVLFSQTRSREGIDSIKAAATNNLKSVSKLLSNNPGTRLANIDVIDSGEYLTIVTRFHIARAYVIAATPLSPVTEIKTQPLIGSMYTVAVPAPPPMLDEDPLSLVSVFTFKTDATVIPPDMATAPDLPPLLDEDPLSLVSVFTFKTDTTVTTFGLLTAPAPPPLLDADPLLIAQVFTLKTDIPVLTPDALTAPPLPDLVLDKIDPTPVLAIVSIPVKNIPSGRADTLAVPDVEEKRYPVMEMHFSDEGYSLLEKLEGFSPELYSLKDGGYTIGFGFFVPYGDDAKWAKGLTWEQAEKLIRQKMPTYEDQLKRFINVPLTQTEFDALTMLAYNLGSFSRATSIVNDVNSQADFDKLQSDWNRFVHSKAPGVTKGLINRRKDELGVRNEANYQLKRKVQILKIRRQ